jgi:DNA processing protein
MAPAAPELRRSATAAGGACARCVRRAWVLAALGGPLDHLHRDPTRLIDALALEDEQLIEALGGRRRAELRAGYAALSLGGATCRQPAGAVCVHDGRFPDALRFAFGPRALYVAPSAQRLQALACEPTVAIAGTRRASDYGLEVARGLGAELAVAGVTVVACLAAGVGWAALEGASDAGGTAICVQAAGLEERAAREARGRAPLTRRGCVIAELSGDDRARRWGVLASQRVLAGLARLTVVVEAEESERELAPARVASTLGRTVAAVPGRITSPLAAGPNALLAAGARVVLGATDALELLVGSGSGRRPADAPAAPALAPRLRSVLAGVSAGRDTPDRLAHEGANLGEVLYALSELELLGLLTRGDGGRYLARHGATGRSQASARRPSGG